VTDGVAGALRHDKANIDIGQWHDLGVLLIYNGVAMREVEGLALCDKQHMS